MYKDYGSIIKNARLQKGLSQENLAIKLGVSRQAISNWETNKCIPDVSIIPNLCKILDMNIYDFFDNKKGKEILDYETKKTKFKFITKMAFLIIIILISIIMSILIIFRNKFEVYELEFENSLFKSNSFLFIYSKDELILNIGSISDLDEDAILTFYIGNKENKVIYSANYSPGYLIKEDYGYNDSLNILYKNMNNLYLRIDTLKTSVSYKIKFNKILGKKAFIYKKVDSIGNKENDVQLKTFSNEILESNGYSFNSSFGHYEKNMGIFNYVITNANQCLTIIGSVGDEEITLEYNYLLNMLDINIYNAKIKKCVLRCFYDFDNKRVEYHVGNDNVINYIKMVETELNNLAIEF